MSRLENYETSCEKWHNISLTIRSCGRRVCGADTGMHLPKQEDNVLFYVQSGSGTMTMGNQSWQIEAGNGFLVLPQSEVLFDVDPGKTAVLYWVCFTGFYAERYLMRANLCAQTPVFCCSGDGEIEKAFINLVEVSKRRYNRYCHMLGMLYTIMARLIDHTGENREKQSYYSGTQKYVWDAIGIIEKNFDQPLAVEQLAQQVGLTRKYFYHLFKVYMNTSPQEYLIKYRIHRACELIRSSNLPIDAVAKAVGYQDRFHFSKIFKRVVGMPPGAYANMLVNRNAQDAYYQAELMRLNSIIKEQEAQLRSLKCSARPLTKASGKPEDEYMQTRITY